MLTKVDWQIIKQAKKAGCEIPALSIFPPDHWLVVAKEFLEAGKALMVQAIEADDHIQCTEEEYRNYVRRHLQEVASKAIDDNQPICWYIALSEIKRLDEAFEIWRWALQEVTTAAGGVVEEEHGG